MSGVKAEGCDGLTADSAGIYVHITSKVAVEKYYNIVKEVNLSEVRTDSLSLTVY